MNDTVRLLVVDDDADDNRLTLAALEAAGIGTQIRVLSDGAEALDYLCRRGAFADIPSGQPALVLLDLKMPKVDGFEVLEAVKRDPAMHNIPIVVLTTSNHESDIERAYSLGANGYMVKPMAFDDYVTALGALGRYWLQINVSPAVCSAPKRSALSATGV